MAKPSSFEGWGADREGQYAKILAALAANEIRLEIECDEARHEWFAMARSMYVENNPEPRFPIDVEVGIHLGRCATQECRLLATAYEELLRPSHPDAAELLADTINQLETTIFPPEIP
jgi:hypothetical protein